MNASAKHIVYSIGHSNRTMDDFIAMLLSFDIKNLIDIRAWPGSGKYPQFNRDNLQMVLADNGINYIYMKELGGRRRGLSNSKNNRWNNPSFRAYADYIETDDFEKAITELERIAIEAPTVYMCSEAVWWRCHRSLVSDYLKAKGWTVRHIMGIGKMKEHTYTSPAIVIGDHVSYAD